MPGEIIEQRAKVAPGLRAGRGLKLFVTVAKATSPDVAPGLRAGRGLKRATSDLEEAAVEVAPGLRAGRGLKPCVPRS